MRIIAKKYAQLLYTNVINKKKDEARNIIKAFVGLLAEENVISQTDKIINEFIKIWNKEQGIVEAEIKSARELDETQIKSLQSYIKKLAKARTVEIKTVENKNLLGGVVIKYGDKILDASLLAKLDSLKQEIKK